MTYKAPNKREFVAAMRRAQQAQLETMLATMTMKPSMTRQEIRYALEATIEARRTDAEYALIGHLAPDTLDVWVKSMTPKGK